MQLTRASADNAAGRQRAERSLTRSLETQSPIAGKSPGAPDEHADPDPFALGIRDALDASVLRRHELVALEDDPRIRVLRSSRGCRIERGCTEFTHSAA